MENGYLHFCPRCGRQDLDRESHGSPGTALCNACGTLFSIMSVRFGEKMVAIDKATKVATGAGAVPEEPSAESTLPVPDDETADDSGENTLRIKKKPASS